MGFSSHEKYLDVPIQLLGVPGSGKTKYLIDCVEANPSINFLIISFSNFSVDDISSKFQIQTSHAANSSAWRETSDGATFPHISTFHKVAIKLISNIESDLHFDFREAVETAVALQEFWQDSKYWKEDYFLSVDWIIVDEAQDMSTPQFQMIYRLANKLSSNLTFAGDPNQSIFRFQGGTPHYLMKRHEYPVRNPKYLSKNPFKMLCYNWRCSEPIDNTVQRIANNKDIYRYRQSNRNSKKSQQPKVCFKFHHSKNVMKSQLLKTVSSWKSQTHPQNYCQIAVISPTRKPFSVNGSLDEIYEILSQNNIPTQVHDSTMSSKTSLNRKAIQLLSVHNAKGLEYEKVVVLGYCNEFLPHEHDPEVGRDMFHVAFSRARYELTVMVPNHSSRSVHDSFFDLFEIEDQKIWPQSRFITHNVSKLQIRSQPIDTSSSYFKCFSNFFDEKIDPQYISIDSEELSVNQMMGIRIRKINEIDLISDFSTPNISSKLDAPIGSQIQQLIFMVLAGCISKLDVFSRMFQDLQSNPFQNSSQIQNLLQRYFPLKCFGDGICNSFRSAQKSFQILCNEVRDINNIFRSKISLSYISLNIALLGKFQYLIYSGNVFDNSRIIDIELIDKFTYHELKKMVSSWNRIRSFIQSQFTGEQTFQHISGGRFLNYFEDIFNIEKFTHSTLGRILMTHVFRFSDKSQIRNCPNIYIVYSISSHLKIYHYQIL